MLATAKVIAEIAAKIITEVTTEIVSKVVIEFTFVDNLGLGRIDNNIEDQNQLFLEAGIRF